MIHGITRAAYLSTGLCSVTVIGAPGSSSTVRCDQAGSNVSYARLGVRERR
jgi:hypothetical protein